MTEVNAASASVSDIDFWMGMLTSWYSWWLAWVKVILTRILINSGGGWVIYWGDRKCGGIMYLNHGHLPGCWEEGKFYVEDVNEGRGI